MLIKDKERDTWITCKGCGAHLRASKGGTCKCGGVKVEKPDENGVQAIYEDDEDMAVMETDE